MKLHLLFSPQVPLFQSYSATYYKLKEFVVRRANGKLHISFTRVCARPSHTLTFVTDECAD